MPTKGTSFWVFVFGYLILAAGVINVVFDLQRRVEWWLPTDIGVVVGETALFLAGLGMLIVAKCILKLEKRLDAIEAKQR